MCRMNPSIRQLLLTARQGMRLTIKLSHLLTQLNFTKNSLELRLIDTGDKPASHIGERLTKRWLKDLQNKAIA